MAPAWRVRRVEVSMPGRRKTLVLAAVAATAALVPLFGDPRQTPVTHALWARMLLRSLEMTEAVRASAVASQVFATLSWRDSLSFPADAYAGASGASVRDVNGVRLVTAEGAPAEVTYAVAIVQPGDYLLRARLAGASPQPATAELVPFAGGPAPAPLTFVPGAGEPDWVIGGARHLDPGSYRAQFLLPPGCSLARVELAPPCLNPIEPSGGWRSDAIATTPDVALTVLKAIEAEHELAPAAEPIEATGADFTVEWPETLARERAAAGSLATMRLQAHAAGARALVTVEVPEPGLYSVTALATPGAGQRWLLDGCRKAILCPGPPGWRAVLAQRLSAGRHVLVVTLGNGAALDQLRIERKKDSGDEYVAALRRLGLDLGADGPVSRAAALDAARFVREQRRLRPGGVCGDTVPDAEALPPQLALQPGPGPVPVPPVPPPNPPVLPPVLPPQEPATPTLPTGGA
jgi:hypothetical protein